MTVTIRKTESGYSWQPPNGKAYPIDLIKIFPDRARMRIFAAFANNPRTALTWRFYLYQQGSGILFLSDDRF